MTERIDTQELWIRARDAFLDLADLGEGERARELARLAASDSVLHERVLALLAHDRPPPQSSAPAPRFGPYQPIRKLGSGGMGEVWLARRVDGEFEREVAIKVMRVGIGGDEVVRRFLRERQTLASLDHEYIARMHDGGTTESGLPYLVLEHVDGVALDAYCRQRALDIRARVRLFTRVLAAVAHAHDRGVIHRDLKPSNILVRPDGTPRLLDFGISRIRDAAVEPSVEPLTRAGHRLFTPEYASPEQVRGLEVGEASDIFSLGVILYQLLAGERPWSRDLDQATLEREIVEMTPRLPSHRVGGAEGRALEGDLDTIVDKCLRKEPWERYARVVDLLHDIELYLRGEPIVARRTGVFERFVRGVRRKPALAAATLALLVVATYAVWQTREADARRRELVRTNAARVENAIDARQDGRVDESAAELEAVLAALDDRSDTAGVRARAHVHRAIAANHRRDFELALDHLAKGAALIDPADESSYVLRASLLNARSYALFQKGDRTAAGEAAAAALAHCREHLPPGDPRTIDALVEIADQRRDGKPTAEDYSNIDAVVSEARLRGDPRDSTLGSALNLAALLRADGFRYEEAAKLYQEAIAVLGWHHGEGHEAIALLRANLGDAYFRLGRFDEARVEHERALAARRERGDAGLTAISLEYLARIAIDTHDYDLAASLLAEQETIVTKSLPPTHYLTRRCRLWNAILLADRGESSAARTALESLLASHATETALAPEHEAQARLRLGRILLDGGEPDAARTQLQAALGTFERLLGPLHRDTRSAQELLEQAR